MRVSQSASLALPFLTLTAHPAIGALLLDPRAAWVWNSEGNRILWANTAGVDFFGESNMEALLNRTFGDVHPARRHLARLARNARTGTPMLDRLRFFLGEDAVTAPCLCKRLEVQGETVLLIMATEQPEAKPSDHDSMQSLLDNLAGDGDIQAGFVNGTGQMLAQSGSITQLLGMSHNLKKMIGEADTPSRLAADTIVNQDGQTIAALARVGEEDIRHYLVLLHNAADEQSQITDTRALLFAELDAGTQDYETPEDHEQGADIFSPDFGLAQIPNAQDNVTGNNGSVHGDGDVYPFLVEENSGGETLDIPANNITHLNDATNKTTKLKAALASGASIPDISQSSNIITLPFAMDKNGPNEQSSLSSGEEGIHADKDAMASSDFKFDGEGGPYHFVWESDELGRLSMVSPELAKAVGPNHASVVGLHWHEIAQRLSMDDDGAITKAFESRDTWAGLIVQWPVEGHDLRVPVELTGLPVFGRYHGFQGFRGFGVCDAQSAASATKLPPAPLVIPSQTADPSLLPQFNDNADLLSDDLLLAARNAVVAAEEMVSAGTDDLTKAAGEKLAGDGADTVSNDLDDPSMTTKGGEDAQDGKRDADQQSQMDSGSTNHDIEAPKGVSPDVPKNPFDLVSSLLSGSPDGVKELEPQPEQPDVTNPDEGSGPDVQSEALSDGERDAFDEIAAALTDGAKEGQPSDAEDKATAGEKAASSVVSGLVSDTSGAHSDDETIEREAHQSKIREVLKTRPQTDETVRSAANSAFRDILAMDPAFRHMQGHLAELSGAVDDSNADEPALLSEQASDESTSKTQDEGTEVNTEIVTPETGLPENDIAQNEAPEVKSESDNDAHTTADEHPNDTSQDLVAAAVAGTAVVAGASLWDRKDDNSPLIDLLDKLPTAIIVSAGSQILFASKKALRMLGFETSNDLEEAGGMEGLFTGRPGDWLTKTDGRTTLRGGDGTPVSVLATISSINWGERPAAMLSFEDAQESPPKRGVSEEDEKIAELEGILDTATDGVVVLDGEGAILRMNHSAEALFETDRHEVAGESFLSLLADESHKHTIDYLDSLKSNGVASVLNDGREVIGRIQSGGLLPLFMTMGRISIPGTSRFCVVLRDIAQWKRAQELLVTDKLSAESASQQKSDFLAKVSHEIRTPLNAIIGFSEVMLEERFGAIGSTRYKDYLKDISVSGKHITSLINDLLDLSKVEAGKLDMQFEATQLNRLISESVGIMQPQANREQIIIRSSLGSKLPEIAGDSRSLRQIILNLLSNALKFTDAGGQVIVSTSMEQGGELVLRIRDTGIGMSEEDLKTALEPFRQVSSTRGTQEGTGLGLPLTKALVEANHAILSISSEKDHGTLVEVTFPKERVIIEQDA